MTVKKYFFAIMWIASISMGHCRGEEDDAKAISHCPIKIVGTASGGTVSLGFSGNTEKLITVTTQNGETSAQVAAKLAQKAAAENLPHISVEENSNLIFVANNSEGDIFYRSTDAGLPEVANVSNLKCTSHKSGSKVTLTWTLQSPAPETIFIYRSNHPLTAIDGTSTSYEDTKFNSSDPSGTARHTYAVICGHNRNADNIIERYSDITEVKNVDNPEYMASDTFHITSLGIGDSRLGKPFQWALRKNGGVDPIVWSIDSGGLPPGITLDSQGMIQGSPTQKGSFSFTAKATGATGASATKTFSMEVKD